ncbi:MAG: diguanylate cyclase, partial [Ancylobacter novellus]
MSGVSVRRPRAAANPAPARRDSPGRRAMRRFLRHRLAVFGLAVIVLFVLGAILAPLIAPYDPTATSWSLIRKPPSLAHWFGTDENGRDVLSRTLWGARTSLMAGGLSVAAALAVGVPLGMLAGLAGGWVDALISRITDAMLSVPFLILAIALAAFLGPALENAMLAIAISAAPIFVRLARGMAMEAKATEWVEAARALGNPPWRTAVVHV